MASSGTPHVNVRALVIKSGTQQQIPSADSLLVGSGIDASEAGPLSIGASAADEITIGKIGITTTFPGEVNIQGNVNTVGGTTFTDDVTFQGNTTFGNDLAPDSVTFSANTTVDLGANKITNVAEPLSAQDGATKAYADGKLALPGGTMSGAIAMGSKLITSLSPGVTGTDAANLNQVNAIAAIEYDQQIFVAAGADPLVATGAPLRPFASISAAMAAITDALPTKRYAISVAAGSYTEATTTIAVSSNGQALPQGTINVVSTTGFLSAGLLSVTTSGGVQTVSYTGKTADSFTGCTGGTGTMSTGGAVGAIIALKPNVFIVGVSRDAVRITASAFVLDASFTGGADNRTGISNAVVTGTASFNFTTVTSAAGKLYFRDTSFNSAVTLTGYNNASVQAQFSGCQMYEVFTVQGVNVGVFNDNILYSNIVLTQSPFGGVVTSLVATGGACSGTVTATTTVDLFNRRISIFARSFWMNGAVTVDGPRSYLDYTVDSLPSGGASTLNGGNLVSIDYGANKALSNLVYPTAVNNPIIPASTNATNMGDWNKQWFFSFGYVHLSSGTDLYIGSAGTSAAADSAGRAVYLQPDQYGVDVNVNGGVLDLRSANTTGTGISGNVDVNTGTSVNGNSGDVTLTTGRGHAGAIAAGSNGQALPSAVINVASLTGFPSTGTILVATSTGTQTVTYTGTTSASTTVAAGSNGQALPQGTINVDSTASFLAAGTLRVTTSGGAQTVTYTGKTATSFTGCTGGAGTMSTGGAVAQDVFTGCTGGTGTMSTGGEVEFSGIGTRGIISLDGRQIDANSTKIVNLANGTNPNDAVNYSQLSAIVTSAQGGANAIQYANASTSTDFDGDNAKFTFDEGTSIMAVAGGGSTLSVGSDSLTSTAAALDIEGASSVSASITGGATFLLTPSSVQTGFATLGALAFSLDPSLTPYKQVGALTGDISLSNAANLGPARGITIKIIGDTVSRNITSVPASWKWLGGPAPEVVEGGKTAILSIACFGGAQSDIVASWSYDGSSSVTGVGVDNQIAVWSGASSLDSSSGLTWNSATAAFAADGSAVFNDSGANRDFRVEAVGNANMLFVDASQASVSIGTTGANHTFNIGAGAAANFGVGSGGRIHTYDGSDPANGEILIGDGSIGVKNFNKTTLGAGTNIAITNGAGSIDIDLTGQVAVANGGTGVSTITAGSLVVGDGANAVNEIAPGSNGDVLTVVLGAWASTAVPAATDYSVAAIITAAAVNTAVTVAGAAAIATTAVTGTARVAGIVKATDSVKVLGIQTCIVESGRAGLITQGEPVYLSASEPGKVTDLAPKELGEIVAELGIATAADDSGVVTVLWQPKSIVVL